MKDSRLADIQEQVSTITDALGKPIDEGIVGVVVALLFHGFTTTQSCEGHSTHGIPMPWVEVEPEGLELESVHDEYGEYDRPRSSERYPEDAAIERAVAALSMDIEHLLDVFYGSRLVSPPIQLVVRRSVWYRLRITNRGSKWWKLSPWRTDKLQECQAEMHAFAEFILAR